jgi:type I restriction enzyme M protein
MLNFLFIEDDEALTKPGIVLSIYDPTAGTDGMLNVVGEHLDSLIPPGIRASMAASAACSMASRSSPASARSGESEIRRSVLENDLLEAIIGLPTDMFCNTVSTYVWIVSNR